MRVETKDNVKEGLQLARDLFRMTLHGAPPMKTIMLIASAAVELGAEVERLTDEVDGFVESSREDSARLRDAMNRLDRIGCLASGEAE